MKKFFSITALVSILAIGSAFMNKAADPQWELYDGSIVTGTAAFVKSNYCPGANTRTCAVRLDDPTQIIMRP